MLEITIVQICLTLYCKSKFSSRFINYIKWHIRNGQLLSIEQIFTNTGVIFNLVLYLRLQNAMYDARHLFSNNRQSDKLSTLLFDFLRRFKKGSRPIRNILSSARNKHKKNKRGQKH